MWRNRFVQPPSLKSGDTIGLVSTSSPVTPQELGRLVGYFRNRGHPVKIGSHTSLSTGYLAGTAEQRAADFMAAVLDPEIRAIVPTSGGKGAAHLLSLIDYDAVRANPKVITGISDPSILLNAILAQSGLVTLHGPSGYDFFQPHVDRETERDFWRIVTSPVQGRVVSADTWRVIRGAGTSVRGRVIGGHLGTIRSLVGTPWIPDSTGAVLILEEVFVPWSEVDQALTHLRLAGVFDQVAAVVMGVPVDCPRDNSPDADWDSLILRCVGGSFPVLANVEFGHTARKIPLVIGGEVELTLDPTAPQLEYLGDLVRS